MFTTLMLLEVIKFILTYILLEEYHYYRILDCTRFKIGFVHGFATVSTRNVYESVGKLHTVVEPCMFLQKQCWFFSQNIHTRFFKLKLRMKIPFKHGFNVKTVYDCYFFFKYGYPISELILKTLHFKKTMNLNTTHSKNTTCIYQYKQHIQLCSILN